MEFPEGPKLTAEISFITYHDELYVDEIIRHLVLLMAIRIIGLSGIQNICAKLFIWLNKTIKKNDQNVIQCFQIYFLSEASTQLFSFFLEEIVSL